MYIEVNIASQICTLREPEVFTAFSARSSSTDASVVGPAMGAAGRAADEADHVWVAVDWLRAAGPDDAAWRDQLDGMIAYAATKGWTDDASTHIKAHLEQS